MEDLVITNRCLILAWIIAVLLSFNARSVMIEKEDERSSLRFLDLNESIYNHDKRIKDKRENEDWFTERERNRLTNVRTSGSQYPTMEGKTFTLCHLER